MTNATDDPVWYCIHTAPKQESKVVILLQREVGVETFAPKIRFRRGRAGRPIWWTEALFPGYVFARFDHFRQHRQIRARPGVSTIVHFGKKPTSVSEETLAQLRASI
ncbi:MAG: transcription termination/antitermination NusG family protein, partial [Chthoniobacterales bacterium]